jgi:hypothetical protein
MCCYTSFSLFDWGESTRTVRADTLSTSQRQSQLPRATLVPPTTTTTHARTHARSHANTYTHLHTSTYIHRAVGVGVRRRFVTHTHAPLTHNTNTKKNLTRNTQHAYKTYSCKLQEIYRVAVLPCAGRAPRWRPRPRAPRQQYIKHCSAVTQKKTIFYNHYARTGGRVSQSYGPRVQLFELNASNETPMVKLVCRSYANAKTRLPCRA